MIETSIYILMNSIILLSVHFVYKKTKFNPFIDILIVSILGLVIAEYLRLIFGMSSFINSSNIYYLEYINIILLIFAVLYFFKFIFRNKEDYSRFR